MKKSKVVKSEVETEVEETEKVRVYKVTNSSVTHICGEKVQIDEEGKEYFLLQKSAEETVSHHSNLIWPTEE